MKTILITRPRQQAKGFAQELLAAGYQVVFFPVIVISPMEDYAALDKALQTIARYSWVVFTSVNGVEAVWSRLKALGIQSLPAHVRLAAIGPKTAEALLVRQQKVDYVPQEYVAEAILPGLGDLAGKWVLLPRAEIARKALPEAICAAGGLAHEIAVYRTLPAQPDPDGWEALKQGVDVITLTSPSTVQNFVALAKMANLDPQNLPGQPIYACIGPITAQSAEQEGLSPRVMADQYTTQGLLQAIQSLEKSIDP
jgi:uroporphyrinogen III methyltransferase/synthase